LLEDLGHGKDPAALVGVAEHVDLLLELGHVDAPADLREEQVALAQATNSLSEG